MAAALFEFLRNTNCLICTNRFEDGVLIRFHGPCWVHPLCDDCSIQWEDTNGGVDFTGCPLCRETYNGSKAQVRMEPWHMREPVDYPSLVPKGPGLGHFVGHRAPCCNRGFKSGDYIVLSICTGWEFHCMHAWCFLANWLNVDGTTIRRAQPFDCFWCGEEGFGMNYAINCAELKTPENEPNDDEGQEQEPTVQNEEDEMNEENGDETNDDEDEDEVDEDETNNEEENDDEDEEEVDEEETSEEENDDED